MYKFKQDVGNEIFYSRFCNSGLVDRSSLNFLLSSTKLEVAEYFLPFFLNIPLKQH